MKIAIVDPGSFVLPYDYALGKGLISTGHNVTLYCSHTLYNAEFADTLADSSTPGASVFRYRISRSTGTTRLGALTGYLKLVRDLLRKRKEFDLVLLQFSIFVPLELLLVTVLRKRFAYVIHNTSPHDRPGRAHLPTYCLALLAHRLVFVSEAERKCFMDTYKSLRHKRHEVIPHGLIQAHPSLQPGSYDRGNREPALPTFIGLIKPYKDIDFPITALEGKILGRLEIFGQWDPGLTNSMDRALAAGAVVHNEFIDGEQLHELLCERRIFLLLHGSASQSGLLYLLLNYAVPFVTSDQGDLADFLVRHDLEQLLVKNRSLASLEAAMDYALKHYDEIAAQLQRIRPAYHWPSLLTTSLLISGE